LDYRTTFIIGLGFFTVALVWSIYNVAVPLYLDDLGLSGLLVGVVMTFMYDLWGEPWIWIAVAGFLASSFIGGGLISKRAKALEALVASNGPADPGVRGGLQRLLAVSRIDLVILIIVIWDMVYKPFA